MRLLSWNVQFGKSCDGQSDFSRTLEHIKSLGEFDVICLQELARNMPEYCIPGQTDHLRLTEHFFEGHSVVWGSGFSWPGNEKNNYFRQEFGNVTLVKSGLLDYRIHQLPMPATPGKKQMCRVAVETVIDSKIGPLSIINTHLAFHDNNENQLQLERISQLEAERIAHQLEPKETGSGIYQEGFSAAARLLCGDFNFTPDSSQYHYQTDMKWLDAWRLSNRSEDHPPTCGIFDSAQWAQGEHCRDYFWLSHELQTRVNHINVDIDCKLSDHQPVILEISI